MRVCRYVYGIAYNYSPLVVSFILSRVPPSLLPPARLHYSLHGSHYSVLFGRQVAERGLDPLTLSAKEAPDRFDLVYYDELAMQDEPIILTVDQYPDQPLSPMELGTDKNRCDFNARCVCVCVCVVWCCAVKTSGLVELNRPLPASLIL